MKTLCLLLLFILANAVELEAQMARLRLQKLKSAPRGKFDMAFATDRELIYLIGGAGHRQNFTNDIFTYHAKYDLWLKLRTGRPFEARKKGSAIYFPEQDRIYILGGVGEFEPDHSAVRYVEYLLPDVEYIDAKTKRVEKWGENLHEGAKVGLASWEGKLYLFGGSIGAKDPSLGFGYLAGFHELDPFTGEWEELPSMPHAKETQGCIIDGILYTFGGFNGATFNEIHSYNIVERTWRKIGELPKPLRSHVVTSWKNFVFLVGDVDDLNYLAIYNTLTGKIREFQTNIRGHSRGACVIGDKLYVFGGLLFSEQNSSRDSLFVLDLKGLL